MLSCNLWSFVGKIAGLSCNKSYLNQRATTVPTTVMKNILHDNVQLFVMFDLTAKSRF